MGTAILKLGRNYSRVNASPIVSDLSHDDPVGSQNWVDGQWAVVAGALPPGITIAPSTEFQNPLSRWNFQGTPTVKGLYPPSITENIVLRFFPVGTPPPYNASNTQYASSKSWNFVVYGDPAINPNQIFNAQVGSAFSENILTPPFEGADQWSAINLPPGLSINPLSGQITGTPTLAGTFTPTITATATYSGFQTIAQDPSSDVKNITIIVEAAAIPAGPPVISQNQTILGVVGEALSFMPSVAGVVVSWAIAGLPAGLSINSQTGIISGTPTTAGSFTASLTVTNSSGQDTESLAVSVSNSVPAAATQGLMKNLWVKKTSQASAQFNANPAAFNGQFLRGEDIVDMDWLLEGLPAAQYDRSQEKILLTEGAPDVRIRYENANFMAAYGGEYIDAQTRQTILHARINTTDARAAEWITEAFLLPGVAFRLRVLFYTNMFNTILRLGGPTLHYATYKVPHTFEAQDARSGRGLTQLVNEDGSQTFVRTAIDCGEDEHVVFAIKNPGGMQETQTSLIVVAER